MLWDAASFLHRPELRWRDQGIHDLAMASLTTAPPPPPRTRSTCPAPAPSPTRRSPSTSTASSFRGLWHGDTRLANGSDYTVSGNTLTLTSAALTRLVGDRAYGVNSTIEARFSQGVPWRLNIITYDPPTQAAATGTTGGLTIPTQFRGDQLATMEAQYPDGSPAGPPTGHPL